MTATDPTTPSPYPSRALSDTGYIGRHRIPGDGDTTLRLLDRDTDGDVIAVRHVTNYQPPAAPTEPTVARLGGAAHPTDAVNKPRRAEQ